MIDDGVVENGGKLESPLDDQDGTPEGTCSPNAVRRRFVAGSEVEVEGMVMFSCSAGSTSSRRFVPRLPGYSPLNCGAVAKTE